MNNGFIVLQRKLLEWEWYHDNNCVRIFLHCLLKANWKNKSWRGQEIPRGTFITSISNLASETNLTIKQTRTVLRKLENTGELLRKGANKYSMITVTEYEFYQDADFERTNEGQTKGKQRATTKQSNKGTKNILPPIVPQNIWDEWYQYRKKTCGKKFTERAQQLSILKLDELAQQGEDLEAVVNQSIERGYKGLFPIKGRNDENSKPTSESVTRELIDEIERAG